MRKLRTTVHVMDDAFRPHAFGPGDEVPAWAAEKITNPKAWVEEVDDPEPADEPSDGGEVEDRGDVGDVGKDGSDEGDGEPADEEGVQQVSPDRPRGNASRAEWAAYAESVGVAITGEMSRDDLIDAVDRAGQE